ncbi:MAG: GNAT family N-acetyltransferase [Chloroflexota bacterium]|nr:GNAT family N-acetyltransferase [Chloroflexota bacterium]
MQVTISRATPDDAEAISAVWEVVCAERVYTAVNRAFTPQQEQTYIASLSNREGIFLAEVDGRLTGFQSLDLWAKYTDSFDHVGVMGTIILPKWRRRGIGHRLAEHTLAFARANGYEKIIIYVRAGNTGARAFYRSLGFAPKGILARQVKIEGQYENEIFMELFL